ncbi:Uncharacterized membrane protein YckC, RDD family [Agreia bicolorata]|uniref:Uncharacterized membrane protein YckC, RDD family n=1 Tax=Agreia bicolorata TaxID=110935 RepID=A0A1T4YAW5_9MICO|nr:RDD family protein [Agreia bicolorata]SKA98451.1 Uncharacterized membrane protein YckC, RDD family [Agreia bicolorata]
MDAVDLFSRVLSARSTLPSEFAGLESDPLWAALLTSVQNVVLGEIRAGRYPVLADESQRSAWPALLDRLGNDARVRIGREIVDKLTVSTVDELWVSCMRVVGGSRDAGAAVGSAVASAVESDARGASIAVTSGDPVVQERIVDLLEALGEIVDTQLADRFGVRADDPRPEPIEFSLSDAGPAPEPVTQPRVAEQVAAEPVAEEPAPALTADAGLVVSMPPALAEPPARPAAVPVFEWAPDPSHPVSAPTGAPHEQTVARTPTPLAAPAYPATAPAEHPVPNGYSVPPGDPGWRPLPTMVAGRTPAPIGRRAGAFLIDRAITILITAAAALLFVWPAVASASSSPDAGGLLIALAFIGVAALNLGWLLVVAWLVGTRGASPGKRIMRIEVTGFSSPGPIGFGRALLREVILAAFTIGSILTAWLPYASVFWDQTKQLRGWHDKAVDDIVVEVARL